MFLYLLVVCYIVHMYSLFIRGIPFWNKISFLSYYRCIAPLHKKSKYKLYFEAMKSSDFNVSIFRYSSEIPQPSKTGIIR